MTDLEILELKAMMLAQHSALYRAGTVLSEIGQSRSKYADEAWAAFSEVLNVAAAFNAMVLRDQPAPKFDA